jgi:hypothetical protein
MEKVEEYRRKAAECHDLAMKAVTPELRKTYRDLADTWSKLAGERLTWIVPQSETGETISSTAHSKETPESQRRYQPMVKARITPPAVQSGEMEFWASEPELMEAEDDNWGFSVYSDKEDFVCTFVYGGKETAEEARKHVGALFKGLVFLATEQS